MAGRNDDDMVRSVRVRSTTYLFAGRPDAWSPTYGTPTEPNAFTIPITNHSPNDKPFTKPASVG